MELKLKMYVESGLQDLGLLIVPYGIETCFNVLACTCVFCLLIVPYGIETTRSWRQIYDGYAFNRTLWN